MRCPHCHTDNAEAAKFCNECGQSLAPPQRESLLDMVPAVFPVEDFADLSSSQTVDFSGLETIVDSSYVPPAPSARTGDTMRLPKIEAEEEGRKKSFIADADTEAKSPEELKLRKRKRRIVLGVFAALLAIAASAALITYSMELWGGKVVPDVVGESEANAAYVLEQKGFATESMEVKSDEVQGVVLLTDPAGGKRAPEGGTIVMHISVARVVPNVVGMPEGEAKALIDAEGFTNVEYKLVKSNEEEGRILSISPEPGTESKSASPIVVEVAQAYTVPETEGMTREEAQAALEAEGYEVNLSWHYDEELPEGMAYSTDPAAGTKHPTGSEVTLSVTMKRSTVLINETSSFLRSSKNFNIGGTNYQVSSVDSVTYEGNDVVAYQLTAKPYETYYWFGSVPETRYGDPQKVTGTITWNSSNAIASSSPAIKKL